MAITYNPGVDYSALIAQEAAKGVNANSSLLAQYESQRNQKIADQGLSYSPTYIYTSRNGGTTVTGGTAGGSGGGSAGANGSVSISRGSISPVGSEAAAPSGGYYTAKDQSGYINSLYDAAVENAQNALRGAYDEAVLGFDAAEAKIPEQYRAARNQTSADAAVQRANINEQLNALGLNTGASGQVRLAMGVAEQSAMAELNRQQQAAIDEITLQRNQARVQYETAVAQAIADNDIERARALYEEAVRVDNSYRSNLEDALQRQQYQMNQLSAEATRQQMQLQAEVAQREQQALEYELARTAASPAGGSGGTSYAPSYNAGSNNVPVRDSAPQTPIVDTAANAAALLDQLRRIPGLTSENKVSMIQDYYNDGRITLGDSQSIAAALGFSV